MDELGIEPRTFRTPEKYAKRTLYQLSYTPLNNDEGIWQGNLMKDGRAGQGLWLSPPS